MSDETTITEFAEMERQVSDLAVRSAQLKREMREGRIKELEDRGERLIVRPVMVQQPPAGERDPWFGLSYWDWLKFRKEGFDGWMETTQGSANPHIMIFVDKAIAWLEARCRRLADARRLNGGGSPQATRVREGKRRKQGRKRRLQ